MKPDALDRMGIEGGTNMTIGSGSNPPVRSSLAKVPGGSGKQDTVASLDEVLESVVMDNVELEERMRKVQGRSDGTNGVELVLEVLPRSRGGWRIAQDLGPLMRWAQSEATFDSRVTTLTPQGVGQDHSQRLQVHHGGVCAYHGAGCLERCGPACVLSRSMTRTQG